MWRFSLETTVPAWIRDTKKPKNYNHETSAAFGSPWQQSAAIPAISGITPEAQSSPQMSHRQSHHPFCPRLSSFVYELISSVSVTPLLEVS